jgi:hypothetical protein
MLGLLVVVTALAGGCASAPAGHGRVAAASSPAAAAGAVVVPAADTPVPGVATAAPAATARSVATSPADVATVAPPSETDAEVPVAAGQIDVEAVATPSCAMPGEIVAVSVHTRGGSTLGFAATFSDAASHGAMGFGEAADDGTFVWRLSVPADAPVGPAKALIGDETAGDRQTGRTVVPFTEAGPGGCR